MIDKDSFYHPRSSSHIQTETAVFKNIKKLWRSLQTSTQKSIHLRHFLHIVSILCSHLQLTLDIHWKNWVTESLSSCLYACGWTKAEQKSPNPTLNRNIRMFPSFCDVLLYRCRGSTMSHRHTQVFIFKLSQICSFTGLH